MQKRLLLENKLRLALERREFIVYYQPKADLNNGHISGMEVLIRWNNPEMGLVSPGSFIPLTEETRLIIPLGRWILQEACRGTRLLLKQGYSDLRVVVNISAVQFWEQDIVELVLSVLEETELPRKLLELEVTESVFAGDIKRAVSILNALHEAGIMITLDDFGTGYSSLSCLRRFPIDTLKIDKSFVDDLPHDREAVSVVNAIISMAHNLNIKNWSRRRRNRRAA